MAEHSSAKYIPEVLILSGLPASGKSLKAKNWLAIDPGRRVRINYDDLRVELFGPNWKWNRKDENLMQQTARDRFENALKLGMSVVVDNTNLSPKVRDAWVKLAENHGVVAILDEVGGWLPIWELAARDRSRGDARVGRAVIERMALFNGFIDWKDKAHTKREGIVICDLDGTLCDISHRRHFVDGSAAPKKDWKSFFANVYNDALNAPVAELLDILRDDHLILLVSGRPIDLCGIATEDWLKRMDVAYDHLFMRSGGDSRDDTIIKREIADLLPLDRVDYVIDDRPKVIRMWQELGLFTLAVGDGKEF